MKVAYLTNQYPKISHTFIRREIAGLEQAGLEVERISVRSSREHLVDERDVSERERTRVLLARGALGLLPDALAMGVSRATPEYSAWPRMALMISSSTSPR